MSAKTVISQEFKTLLIPLVTTVVLAGFIIIAFNGLFGQIVSQTKAIKEAKTLVNVLTQKESVLKENQQRTGQYLGLVLQAYPDENPSLLVLTSVSEMAVNNQVLSENFTMSGNGVTFTLKGQIGGIIAFLKQLNSISPVVSLTSASIMTEEDGFTADVSLKLYWEAYPKFIPSVNTPLEVLTNDDLVLLSNLPPVKGVGQAVIPQGPYQRSNPF